MIKPMGLRCGYVVSERASCPVLRDTTNLQTTVKSSAGSGMDDIAEVLAGEVEQLIEVNAAVCELSEGSLSLDLCAGNYVSVSSMY